MALRNIVLYPDEPLTKVAEPFDGVVPGVLELAGDMFETMEVYDGVGLAGPQVGVSKRIIVLREPGGEEMCLINPVISEAEGSEKGEEGCLSLPEVFAQVERATHIRVQAKNEYGKQLDFEAHDLLARIIQHETDHLDGKVFIDRLDILTREDKFNEWQELRKSLEESHGAS